MAISIQIPPSMQQITQCPAEIISLGLTVQEILNDIQKSFPLLHSKLVDNGQLRDFINIYVNGNDIRDMNNLETTIADGSSLRIITAIAGG